MTSDNKIMIEIGDEHNHLEDSTQKINTINTIGILK